MDNQRALWSILFTIFLLHYLLLNYLWLWHTLPKCTVTSWSVKMYVMSHDLWWGMHLWGLLRRWSVMDLWELRWWVKSCDDFCEDCRNLWEVFWGRATICQIAVVSHALRELRWVTTSSLCKVMNLWEFLWRVMSLREFQGCHESERILVMSHKSPRNAVTSHEYARIDQMCHVCRMIYEQWSVRIAVNINKWSERNEVISHDL